MPDFDEFQLAAGRAIVRTKDNLRIEATAGAGKTTVLVEAIRALVAETQCPASSIMVTTFSADAANQLKQRLGSALGPAASALDVGTFHSLGLRALGGLDPVRWNLDRCVDASNPTQAPKGLDIWRSILVWAKDGVLGLASAKSLQVADQQSLKAYTLEIEVLRAEGNRILLPNGETDPESYKLAKMVEKRESLDRLADAWVLYEKAKRSLNAFDFHDVLEAWLDALNSFLIVPRHAHVFVDEAQDNNRVQLSLAYALAVAGRLVLVGDHSQSIYGFRGACPEVFQSAPLHVLPMPMNYRCGQEIVTAGNNVASKLSVAPLIAKAAKPARGLVRTIDAEDPMEEAQIVAEGIKSLIDNGVKPEEIAILCRVNSQAGLFEGELMRAKVRVLREGGTPFFERSDVLAFLSYTILLQNWGWKAFETIYNRPNRYLSLDFLKKTAEQPGELPDQIRAAAAQLNANSRDRAFELARSLEVRRKMLASGVSGYHQALDDISAMLVRNIKQSSREVDDDRMAIPQVCAEMAKKFNTPMDFANYVVEATQNTAASTKKKDAEGRVVITTTHRAKGREWAHVFVPMPAGIFPHANCVTLDAQEGERRLAYVAVTRAKECLTVSWPRYSGKRKVGPSAFVDDLFGGD